MKKKPLPITPATTILDIVAEHPKTQDVFKSFDQKAGCCIMCQHLFESLEEMAKNCGLDMDELLDALNKA